MKKRPIPHPRRKPVRTSTTLEKIKRRAPAMFACLECGRKFYTVRAAEHAAFGDTGCPGCGGSDIDERTTTLPKETPS